MWNRELSDELAWAVDHIIRRAIQTHLKTEICGIRIERVERIDFDPFHLALKGSVNWEHGERAGNFSVTMSLSSVIESVKVEEIELTTIVDTTQEGVESDVQAS